MKNSKNIPDIRTVQSVLLDYKNKQGIRRNLLSTLIIIVCAGALAAVITLLLCPIEKMNGDNLSPTLDNNDIVLCIKQPYYSPGDLVVISYGDFTLVKRVVATNGDNVDFNDNKNLIVNGKQVDEPYLIEHSWGGEEYENIYPHQVGDESYFVLSDNRSVMTDSRSPYFNDIDKEFIIGRVLFRFWPFDKLAVIQ